MAITTVQNKTSIASVGKHITDIKATFSPQFLGLLSEHLYSSPNKAFEELVTNSWDADATDVYVNLPDNLTSEGAAIYILDNGLSMNVDGLVNLWSIASSQKRKESKTSGRKRIGKFGIGKLATYILCNELTYLCKAKDGIIRIVTMDYREIDTAKSKHLDSVALSVREIKDYNEISQLLSNYQSGKVIYELIKNGIPKIKKHGTFLNEFGSIDPPIVTNNDSWTLAILTSLKDKGKDIQFGWVRRLLSTALPLGSTMNIQLNDEVIYPSKSNKIIVNSWKIGPDLDFNDITLPDGTTIGIKKKSNPYPCVIIEGIGEITGTATLFDGSIAGGKSDQLDDSNGFFVNVLGRVVNCDDNQFKIKHLNQAVFSKFRAAIRSDGLDGQISANRESMAEGDELTIVRSFLQALFNLARRENQKLTEDTFNEASKVRKDNIKAIPFTTLRPLLELSLEDNEQLPSFINIDDPSDLKNHIENWIKTTKNGEFNSLESIEFEDDDPQNYLAKYDLKARKIIINQNHPFALEHCVTKEQRDTLRDMVTIDIMTDMYLSNCGLGKETCDDIITYRDLSQRLIAQIRRRSAAQIVATLDAWKDDAKPFEEIVGDALIHLGFRVKRLGASGEPEGVATAFITPSEEDVQNAYKLTFDAKSTKHKKAQTGNLNIAGLARHRDIFHADYSLVVAPDFQEGALEHEASTNKITPMTSSTLAKLISLSIGYGSISLAKLKEIFLLYSPADVDAWVSNLEREMKQIFNVNLVTLVSSLEKLTTEKKMDVLSSSAIAQKYREITGVDDGRPTTTDITKVLQGLALVAPAAISIDRNRGDKIFILTHPSMLMKEIKRQTDLMPSSLKVGSIANVG